MMKLIELGTGATGPCIRFIETSRTEEVPQWETFTSATDLGIELPSEKNSKISLVFQVPDLMADRVNIILPPES